MIFFKLSLILIIAAVLTAVYTIVALADCVAATLKEGKSGKTKLEA